MIVNQYIDEFKATEKTPEDEETQQTQFSPQRATRSDAKNMRDYNEQEWLKIQNQYGKFFIYLFIYCLYFFLFK